MSRRFLIPALRFAICLFFRQRCSCFLYALYDFLICLTCLAFLVLPRGFTALLDGSRGIYRRFCFSHGLRHYIPHTLYTQSFAFLGTCSSISRPEHCITTFFTLRLGAGLGEKRLLGSHRPLLFFLRSTVSRMGFLDDHKKNGRVFGG